MRVLVAEIRRISGRNFNKYLLNINKLYLFLLRGSEGGKEGKTEEGKEGKEGGIDG